MTRTMTRGTALLAVLIAYLVTPPAWAADWPTRSVRILIPFTAGGTADTLGRIAAQKLSEAFRQDFVPENKPGASGLIAAAEAAKAAPDGYTLFVSGVGGLIIATALSPNPPAAAVTGYTHVAYFGGPPSVLVVNNDVPVKSLKDLIAYTKANPGKLNYGSPSIGSMANLSFSAFQKQAGITLQSIPYAGASKAMADLIGGHIAVTSTALTSAAGTIAGGKVRPLALTAAKRLPDFPDIPTYAEQGYPELVSNVWFALSGPKGMPAEIVNRLNAAVITAMQAPDVQARLRLEGIVPEPMDALAFAAFFKAEYDKWAPIAREAIGKK